MEERMEEKDACPVRDETQNVYIGSSLLENPQPSLYTSILFYTHHHYCSLLLNFWELGTLHAEGMGPYNGAWTPCCCFIFWSFIFVSEGEEELY